MSDPVKDRTTTEIAEELSMTCYHYPPQDNDQGRKNAVMFIKAALDTERVKTAEAEKWVADYKKKWYVAVDKLAEAEKERDYAINSYSPKLRQLEADLADKDALIKKLKDDIAGKSRFPSHILVLKEDWEANQKGLREARALILEKDKKLQEIIELGKGDKEPDVAGECHDSVILAQEALTLPHPTE